MSGRAPISADSPSTQPLARVQLPALAPQPLAVEPVRTCEHDAHGGAGSRSIASQYSPSAASPALNSARERASIPSAQSVPLGRVVPERRWSASAARACLAAADGRHDQPRQAPVGEPALRKCALANSAAVSASR